MSKNTGGPAFPVAIWDKGAMKYINTGLSMRDYFAAKAMEAMIVSSTQDFPPELYSAGAYQMADAMLKAREQS